jgi:hypothetical protein
VSAFSGGGSGDFTFLHILDVTAALQHEGKDGGPIVWQSYPEDESL